MARPPRPRQNQDSAFFWDGVEKGELRIQRFQLQHLLSGAARQEMTLHPGVRQIAQRHES